MKQKIGAFVTKIVADGPEPSQVPLWYSMAELADVYPHRPAPVRDDIADVEVPMQAGIGIGSLVQKGQGALTVFFRHAVIILVKCPEDVFDGRNPGCVRVGAVKELSGPGKCLGDFRSPAC